jgi:hypothetical protein
MKTLKGSFQSQKCKTSEWSRKTELTDDRE